MTTTVTPTYVTIPDQFGGGGAIAAIVVTWANMINGAVGLPIPKNLSAFVDRSFQAEGTFGSGGSVAVEGANNDDGSGTVGNYRALTNPQGTTIAIGSGGIQQVTEAVQNMRPHVTAGDGTTSLTITACLRRAMR